MTGAAAAPAMHDRFGPFGGRYVPETLIPALEELDAAFEVARHDARFQDELDHLLREYVGRPSALTFAPRMTVTGIWIAPERYDSETFR